MAQMGEAVAFALFDPLTNICPFKLEGPETSDVEDESPGNDDSDSAEHIQSNNGGTLGDNLTAGSPAGWGKAGTINDKYPPPDRAAEERQDSRSPSGVRVIVRGKSFGYIAAAHHLIPGNAALRDSELNLRYMKKGESFTTTGGRTYTLAANIGYNVNGNHNGVWLPGNYAIRANKPDLNPLKTTWGSITDSDWRFEYMMACVQQAHGQFHDSHPKYSTAVAGILDKVCTKLGAHQDACEECRNKSETGSKIHPPYVLKQRLYLLSQFLRMQVLRNPGDWKNPWITSDAFKEELELKGYIRPEHVTPSVIAL